MNGRDNYAEPIDSGYASSAEIDIEDRERSLFSRRFGVVMTELITVAK
jgi:hypothetical protein